jgi:hypothetical protein
MWFKRSPSVHSFCDECKAALTSSLQVVESVRVLDKAQANTRKALDRTVDVVGLKSCVEDVSTAMDSEEWEKAAEAIQRYLHVAPEDSVTEVETELPFAACADTWLADGC